MIRKIFQTISLLILTFLFACGGGSNSDLTPGQELRSEADGLYQQQMFSAADQKYREALTLLEMEKNVDDILACRDALERIFYITSTYPLSAEEMRAQLDQAYPDIPEAQRQEWIQSGELEQMEWDGKTYYFEGALENLAYRYPALMHANAEKNEQFFQLAKYISDHFIDIQYPEGQPYGNPNIYIGTGRLNVPRAELPESGLLKLWLPLPVTLDAQSEVSVLSITPETYVREPASLHADISLAYLEVPLDELKSDLAITVKFKFTHYTTRYQVDPNKVGAYDKASAEYQKYTQSYGNTLITGEIRKTAAQVVGEETNPYLQAKMLYDYILKNIKYSFMPHFALWPRGEAESVYVHRMQRGDCGAQSIYFVALCRALGIPARTTGGWQLFKNEFSSHFWAEFFVPNYGWIPVDPTAAELANLTNRLSEEETERFKEFYFGGQDPLRCNAQLDVDLPLIPPAEAEIALPMAIQYPVANSSQMMDPPASIVMMMNLTTNLELISGQGGLPQ